ncbi:DUF4082 domain-containing protein [Sphaerisporangium dianthi]|uniref:DUF4082 domain-containing protein n=1 Tax=Sphaerisporangium dianthi TaxID=1436120 RepID=A0ABV9CPB8_9ACTN
MTSLLVGAGSSPAAAGPSPAPAPQSTVAASDIYEEAKQQAKKQNKRVEIPAYRSENSTTFANPDGKTLRVEMSTSPVRVKRNGTWETIDTTLVVQDGEVRPRVAKSDLALSAGGNRNVLAASADPSRPQSGKAQVQLLAPDKLPAPHLSGNHAEYTSAYGDGIDLVVTATPTGFRQQIIIRKRPAQPLPLRIPVDLPADFAFEKVSGKVMLVKNTSKGMQEQIVDLSTTMMLDAVAADESKDPDEGKVGKATTNLEKAGGGDSTLVLTPDAAFLADPAVTYPVTVAAAASDWWEPSPDNTIDTFVNNDAYPDSRDNQLLDRILVGKSNDGAVRWRSYIKFQDIPADSLLRGGKVQNADLVLWNHLSNACGTSVGSGITARQITSSWTPGSLTWTNQPSVTSTGANTEYGAYTPTTACTSEWAKKEWDLVHSVNRIVQAWADGEANYGFQLTAGNESDLTNWRRYRTTEYTVCNNGTACEGRVHQPLLFVDFEPLILDKATYIQSEKPSDAPSVAEMEDMRVRESDAIPEFPYVSDQASVASARESDARVTVDADSLEPPSDLAPEQLEWLKDPNEGPGYYEASDDSNPPPGPDTTAPSIYTTNPMADAVDIPVDTDVRAMLTEAITNASLNVKNADGKIVPGQINASADGKAIIFTPEQALTFSTKYSVQVADARDSAGHVMTAFSWSFTTRAGHAPEGERARWKFDEGNGTSAADATGHGYDATLSDSTTWVTGKSRSAVSNTGTTGGQEGGSPVSGMTFEDHSDNGYVAFTGADGSQLIYKHQIDGVYRRDSDPADASKVVRNSATQFTHVAADGVKTVLKAVSVPASAPAHLFADTAAPPIAAVDESASLELGVKFTTDKPGLITGVRFYKGPGNTGTHVGNLWSTSGQNLATGTFTDETESGWQRLVFAAPVQVVPGTTYVASYFAPEGHYSFSDDFFSSATDNPPLHAPATADVYGGNGVYAYGPSSAMPSGSFRGGNYWVDVEFVPNEGQPDPALSTVSTIHLFDSATPGTDASTDSNSLELGVKFTADKPGFITGVRFYKGPGNTGTHIGNLWTAGGQKLATGTFPEETESGWQRLTFAAPVRVTAGTAYVASYFAPGGRYAFDSNYFANATDNPPLHAPAATAVYGGNGVYSYGAASHFPAGTYGASNYWVDVDFTSDLTRWVISSIEPRIQPLAQTSGSVIRTDASFTVTAWLRWTDKNGDYSVIEQRGSRRNAFRLGNDPAHGLVFTFSESDTDDAAVEGVLSDVEAPVGEWFHLAGVYSAPAETASLYLNGKLVKTQPISFSTWTVEAPLALGASMQGDLDEVRLFDKRLTNEEIVALRDDVVTPAASPTVTRSEPRSINLSHTAQEARSMASAAPSDDWFYNACWRNETQARTPSRPVAPGLFTPGGYHLSRQNWCGIQHLGAVEANTLTRERTKGFDSALTLLGYTTNSKVSDPHGTRARIYSFDAYIDHFEFVDLGYRRWAEIELGMEDSQPGDGCNLISNVESYKAKWSEWDAGKHVSWTFASLEENGKGDDKVQFCHPRFYSKITTLASQPKFTESSDAYPDVRCDSAPYIVSTVGSGCVFHMAQAIYQTRETLPGDPTKSSEKPDLKDEVQTAYRNVPSHIWTALNAPRLTQPRDPGKSIPGKMGLGLVRSVDKKWNEKNNDKVRDICRNNFKEYDATVDPVLGKPATTGNPPIPVPVNQRKVYECDEFPFESTMQGAWTSAERINRPEARNFSVRPVWWKNNGNDGQRLRLFYEYNRILGVDRNNRKTEYDLFLVDPQVPQAPPVP